MAVTIAHLEPPIYIQNTRNKQSFNTHAYTIDIVPLVLQNYYFAELIFEYKWKTRQTVQSRKRKAEMHEGNKSKSLPTR